MTESENVVEKTETRKVGKKDIVKSVVAAICGASAVQILGNAIAHTTPATTKFIGRIGVGIGTFILGGMLSDAVTNYTDTQIDDLYDGLKEVSSAIEQEQEESDNNKDSET